MTLLIPRKKSVSPLDVFEEFFDTGFFPKYYRNTSRFIAPLNVTSNETSVTVTTELPGLRKDDITIEYHEGVLTISGEKKHEANRDEKGVHIQEISYGDFNRQVNVGDIDFQNADADYSNGVLTITLPKSPERSAKRLAIK